MSRSPPTRPSLLVRVKDARDDDAWRQFVELYAPLIHAYGLRHGLQDADAADLAQEVLRATAGSIGRLDYDQKIGSFRGWLLTITRNKLRNLVAARRRGPAGTGNSAIHRLLEQQPSPEQDEHEWNRKYEWSVLTWAASQIRDEFREPTWRAFWDTMVENRPIKQVADELNLSAGAVYIARTRVLARLKQQVETAIGP